MFNTCGLGVNQRHRVNAQLPEGKRHTCVTDAQSACACKWHAPFHDGNALHHGDRIGQLLVTLGTADELDISHCEHRRSTLRNVNYWVLTIMNNHEHNDV